MKKIIASSFMVVAAVGLLFTSCKKTDLTFDENDKAVAQESASAQQKMADIAGIADEAASKEGFTRLRLAGSSCVSKVYTPNQGHPKGAICTLTFTGDCLDSLSRSGKMIIACNDTTPQGLITEPRNITFENYKVGGTTISGTLNITAGSQLANGFKYTLTLNAKLTEGAQTSSFGGTLTVTLDKGAKDKDTRDDVYYYDGSASGKTYSGTDYSISIDKQLQKFNNYKCIVKGAITFSVKSSTSTSSKTLDFGNGTRDAKATLTVGTVVKDIDL